MDEATRLPVKTEKRAPVAAPAQWMPKDYYLSGRRYASFMRSFQLPEGVDTGKIEATFPKGALTVKLPKTAEGWFSAIVIAALLVTGLVTYVY
jgi:HSP20 family molecular chaperone IbpA